MAFASVYARWLKQYPLPWLIAMPAVMAIIIGVGIDRAEIEDNIYNIWVPTGSAFAKDEAYKKSVISGGDLSLFLGISKPRNAKNAMQADLLVEMADRLSYTQSATVTVDGMDFTYMNTQTQMHETQTEK